MGLFSDIRGQARHPGHSVADAADLTARRAAEPAPGVDMSVDLSGAVLPSPMMTASGCAANGRELNRFFDITELGAFVTKSVMAAPRSGRGTPRMAETPSGMLNSIGLQGPGIEAFVDQDLAWLKKTGARALVSIAGTTSGEFADVAARLRASAAFDAVIGVEVNISCPNVANRGLVFACDPHGLAQRSSRSSASSCPRDMPIFAKLTPDVTDIVTIAQAARQGRRRRADHDQHPARHGHRHRPAAAPAGGRDRRAVGSGGAAGRGARHLAGPRGDARGPAADGADHRGRGSAHRARRPRARRRRRERGAGRAPPRSTTRRRPCASAASCAELLQDKGFERFTDVGRHRPREDGADDGGRTTFGARLRDAMDSRGPLCVGIDPHRAPARAVGTAAHRRRAGDLRR